MENLLKIDSEKRKELIDTLKNYEDFELKDKRESIYFRLDSDLKDLIKAYCKKNNLDINDFLLLIIKDFFESGKELKK